MGTQPTDQAVEAPGGAVARRILQTPFGIVEPRRDELLSEDGLHWTII
jgi:hypothetical protein